MNESSRRDPSASPATPEREPGAFRLLSRAALSDLRSARIGQIVALLVVVAWLAFEWGPGNEIAVPTILMGLLNRIEGTEALLIMPVAGFLLGLGLQLFSGLVAAVGFSMLDNTAHAAWVMLRRWRPTAEAKDFLALGWAGRWSLAFFVGTTAVVLIQLFTTGEATARRHLRAVFISSMLVGATISAIATVVATAVVLGRRYPSVEPYVDDVVGLLANPLFWIGLLAVVLVGSQLVGRFRAPDESAAWPAPET